ncbi:hypothetical protein [Tenacibaculum maritimum]|nr:hypothetical protein [Tenacibaculum maritimum]
MEENSQNEVVCTVDISEGMLDNEFTFYQDGRIKRYYDKNNFNYNITNWVSFNQIRESHKIKILEKLEGDLKERIKNVLYPSND